MIYLLGLLWLDYIKEKIKIDSLRNSFEFYKDLGEFTNLQNVANHPDDEIQDSHYSKSPDTHLFTSSKYNDKEYHYIDLQLIVQNVNIPQIQNNSSIMKDELLFWKGGLFMNSKKSRKLKDMKY